MNKTVLKLINDRLNENGINYSFARWEGEAKYPYFVGEYSEQEETYEDGEMDTTFFLNGFTRGSWLDLERSKETIADLFRRYTTIEDGHGIAIIYASGTVIPEEDADLKRIQINLTIRTWRPK